MLIESLLSECFRPKQRRTIDRNWASRSTTGHLWDQRKRRIPSVTLYSDGLAAIVVQVDHGESLLSWAPAASLVAAAVALSASAALYQRLERRFVFTNYIHAEK